jgi:hypothetical protein
MTAPEGEMGIRGEKTQLYGYTVYIVRKVHLSVDNGGLGARPVVYVIVMHPQDKSGCYVYEIRSDEEKECSWFSDKGLAELYEEVKNEVDALYTMVREKIMAFNALKELLERDGIAVSTMCSGYYRNVGEVIKELQ